jgi:putative transcriptional regulator
MDLKYDFFKIESKQFEIKPGKILISEPFLGDSYFKRSIVFLTEHNKEGSVGFILNKPVNIPVTDLLKDFPDIEAPVSLGGPVGTNTVHYIHTIGEKVPKSVKVYRNIFWGGDFDVIKALIISNKISPHQIRFFVGYSGWMPKQLENEIAENSWLLAEADPELIMTQYDKNVWNAILKGMKDKKYQMWAGFPENPGSN